jgi:hypothetical protein
VTAHETHHAARSVARVYESATEIESSSSRSVEDVVGDPLVPATRRPPLRSALQVLLVGGALAGIGYLIGTLGSSLFGAA